jgi:hypothetical protein
MLNLENLSQKNLDVLLNFCFKNLYNKKGLKTKKNNFTLFELDNFLIIENRDRILKNFEKNNIDNFEKRELEEKAGR